MNYFFRWFQGFICFSCILQMILEVLPDSSYKKYVKFFGGLLTVILLINPLLKIANLEQTLENSWSREVGIVDKRELEIMGEAMANFRNETIERAIESEKKELESESESVYQE